MSKPRWVWGWHSLQACLQNPHRKIHKVYITKASDREKFPGLHIEEISSHHLATLLPPKAIHQGIAAQVDSLPPLPLEELHQGPLLVLDQVTDPHNVGALWRSAAAFGVKGIVLTPHHTPPLEGAAMKAACGAMDHVPAVYVSNLARALDHLRDKGFWCVGLCETGTQALDTLSPASTLALVLGAEGRGLRPLTRKKCDLLVRIPTVSTFSTLNVSVSGAIALYALTQKSDK